MNSLSDRRELGSEFGGWVELLVYSTFYKTVPEKHQKSIRKQQTAQPPAGYGFSKSRTARYTLERFGSAFGTERDRLLR